MGAVEGGQHRVDGRLHAEADPREPGLAERRQVPGGHAVGVGLGRHLDVGGEAELRGDRGQHRGEVARAEEGRRTAAEEDRVDRDVAVAEHASRQPDLGDRGLGVRRARGAGLVAQLLGRVGVEVAVAAPHRAERHVHVEAERSRPQLPEGGRRQGPVGRGRVARGKRGRHPAIQPPRVVRLSQGKSPASGGRPPGLWMGSAAGGASPAPSRHADHSTDPLARAGRGPGGGDGPPSAPGSGLRQRLRR